MRRLPLVNIKKKKRMLFVKYWALPKKNYRKNSASLFKRSIDGLTSMGCISSTTSDTITVSRYKTKEHSFFFMALFVSSFPTRKAAISGGHIKRFGISLIDVRVGFDVAIRIGDFFHLDVAAVGERGF